LKCPSLSRRAPKRDSIAGRLQVCQSTNVCAVCGKRQQ
jgi:hypothetical protein